MKFFDKMCISILIFTIAIITFINIYYFTYNTTSEEKPHNVEIARLEAHIKNDYITNSKNLPDIIKKHKCKYVKSIILCENSEQLTSAGKYNYCLKEINGNLYRFEYITENERNIKLIILLNVSLIFVCAVTIGILIYVRKEILTPFLKLEQIPYELSKGNLTISVDESKNRYFGKFIWGINMLREYLEDRRRNELNLHRDKKLSLLSLTHDIKTPLSVIKLNAQALEKGLYSEKEKQLQTAASICEKVNEIENYVSQITAASQDDFLDLHVNEEEFYLSKVIEKTREYYIPKLNLNKTTFEIGQYSNCLLNADENRLIEVLQNLMENAIKYGDGEKITISFGREEGCCLITVTNTGSDVKPDEMSKLFNSFYRGSNVKNQSGCGLGLYISRQLMHNMNGDIFALQNNGTFSVTAVVRMS